MCSPSKLSAKTAQMSRVEMEGQGRTRQEGGAGLMPKVRRVLYS